MDANQNVMDVANVTALVWLSRTAKTLLLPGFTLRSCNLTTTVMFITSLQYITFNEFYFQVLFCQAWY